MELDIVKTFEEVGEKYKSAKKLPELQAEYRERVETDKKVWAALSAADQDPEGPAEKSIIDNNKRREELEAIIESKKQLEGIRNGADERMKNLNTPTGRLGTPGFGSDDQDRAERKSYGEMFVEDEEVRAWLKQVAPNGNVPDKVNLGKSPAVQLKALITGVSDSSAGALINPFIDANVELPRQVTTILDSIRVQPVTQDRVEFARMISRTNNAAIVPEATTEADPVTYGAYLAAHGRKPMSGIEFERAYAEIESIATLLAASRRALGDAGQLQGIINDEGKAMVRQALSSEVIGGPGGADHLTGVLNTAGLTTQAYDSTTPYPILRTMRKAQTKARISPALGEPNAYWVHPLTLEFIDLITDGEDRYLYGGPSAGGVRTLWGLPVLQDEAVKDADGNADLALCGDFKTVVLYDRQQATVMMTDSNRDWFERNLIALLFELRAGLGVKRPAAIVKIGLDADALD